MPAFDPRILRIGIEVDGQLRVYDDLWMSATISKFANPLQNEAEVKIANLTRDARDFLLTETSPFNQLKKPRKLFIEAGRESIGAFALFQGDITEGTPSQPPDIILTLKAKTKQASKGVVLAQAYGAREQLSTIAKGVADALGLALVFEAQDKTVANYSFTGGALKQVEKLSEAGRVNAYVDDDRLIVKDYNVPLAQATHVLSKSSGLIGVPELNAQGVKVKYLLDPKSQLGGGIELESEIYPTVNGKYVIYKLSYEVSNRDTPFYCIAECKRKGAK